MKHHHMEDLCLCRPCRSTRDAAWFSGVVIGVALAFAMFIMNMATGCSEGGPPPPCELSGPDAPTSGPCQPRPQLAGVWSAPVEHRDFCPPDVVLWSTLELGKDDFVARDARGQVVARGSWHEAIFDNDDSSTTAVAVIEPGPGYAGGELTSRDRVHMGGWFTVDADTDEGICSYQLIMTRVR